MKKPTKENVTRTKHSSGSAAGDPTNLFFILQRNKFLTVEAKSIDDFIEAFEKELLKLKEWKRRGVVLDTNSNISDDYAEFVTSDPIVAADFGFVPPPLF